MKHEEDIWKSLVKKSAVLNPVERIAEVLFGLIMVLTFTGAISIANDTGEDVRELLWAALGCNIAWGLVDAIMYLMDIAVERGHSIKVIKKIKTAENGIKASALLKDEIQPGIAGLMTDKELMELSTRIKKLPEPSKSNLLLGADLYAALQIFLLVFLCTFPVALPFGIVDDLAVAMRLSNGVALLLLFTGGFILAGYAGFRRVLTAFIYMFIGVALVVITMALGG